MDGLLEPVWRLDERQAALIALLAQADPPDLPPRRHHVRYMGDPAWQDRLRALLPVAFTQHARRPIE